MQTAIPTIQSVSSGNLCILSDSLKLQSKMRKNTAQILESVMKIVQNVLYTPYHFTI